MPRKRTKMSATLEVREIALRVTEPSDQALFDAALSAEVWRPVPGSPRYLVSSMGGLLGVDGQPKSLKTTSRGYLEAQLWSRCSRTSWLMHKLVLTVFCCSRPDGYEGSHLNADKTDNRLLNLRWEHPLVNVGRRYGVLYEQA